MFDNVITPEDAGMEITVYRAEADNVLVLHIDTPHMTEDTNGPILRVYLNDEPIYENPAFPGA